MLAAAIRFSLLLVDRWSAPGRADSTAMGLLASLLLGHCSLGESRRERWPAPGRQIHLRARGRCKRGSTLSNQPPSRNRRSVRTTITSSIDFSWRQPAPAPPPSPRWRPFEPP